MEAGGGLRERKKRRTREALVDAAVRLFRERGYEATKVADIAAAADVSTRTFFQHFPAKEDVLWADNDERIDRLLELVGRRRADEPLMVAVRRVLFEIIAGTLHDPPEIWFVRMELVLTTPTLQASLLQRVARIEETIAAWLAKEFGTGPDDLEVRITAAALVHALWAVIRPRMERLQDRVRVGEGSDRSAMILHTIADGVTEDVDRALQLLEHGLATLEDRVGGTAPPA